MKSTISLLAMLTLPAVLFSCKDKIEETYTVNEPIYMSYDELRSSFKVTGEQEIMQPGKIYFKDSYIFINEYQKGIHVVDNKDPLSPQVIKFIEIPGNVDLAIKDSILYADSYVDLVAIDISNMDDIREVKRIENAFPYIIPYCENGVVENVNELEGVVVGWNATERTVSVDAINNRYLEYPAYRNDLLTLASYDAASGNGAKSNTGTGGSMARFTVYDNYLYAVDHSTLRLFDISSAQDPQERKEMYVGWDIETLFPYENRLFLGSTTGMFIYDLSDPSNPHYISSFWHASSCDPVVVEGDYAYVTLRAGNLCGDNTSELDVIDLSDLLSPKLLKEYLMEEPYGLGIDNGILFICDGDAGLKIYDAHDPLTIDKHKLAAYPDIHAWDVIPLGEVLIMIGKDGLYQYDYSDPAEITELSVIPIGALTHIF
jgi:hypothetical protein